MATNLKDGKTAQSSQGSHGGNRAGDKDERGSDTSTSKKTGTKSSQAAGKDPHRGKD